MSGVEELDAGPSSRYVKCLTLFKGKPYMYMYKHTYSCSINKYMYYFFQEKG